MAQLTEGSKAPGFDTPSSTGNNIKLSDFSGKKRVVLYFYPKDDTPGCTIEACGFRDKHDEIKTKNTVILGVSPDGVDSHNKFIKKFDLPFILLADEDKEICKAYGVWVEKNMYGKKYMGVARTTFVIGTDGKIEKIYEKVKPKEHTDEIIEFISA
jgi:thioredoxin-dependent peroxiredoxin